MGRIVVGEASTKIKPEIPGTVDAAGKIARGAKPEVSDGYLDRVVKYIPGEVIAFFIFVNSLLAEAAKGDKIDPTTPLTSNAIRQSLSTVMMANGSISVFAVAKLVLLLGAVMSVIYLVSQREADNPGEYLTLTAIVSFFSFFVWAYAVDAVAFRPIHDGVLASILLASFTLVSGAITPAAQDAMVKMIKFKKAAGNDEQ